MEIGSKLKKARNDKGITQERAAELLDVSRQTISNWENNKFYPDIVSVIKMSDIYSISLDHLLKEDTSMKQTYQEFLEESTNTVRAKRNLGKLILLSTYFFVWVIAMIVLWNTDGSIATGLSVSFKWILLPLLLFALTVTVAKNDYWGKGNWFCVLGAAIMFLTIPCAKYTEDLGTAVFTFIFPNFSYMVIGIIVSICGIWTGAFVKKAASKDKI